MDTTICFATCCNAIEYRTDWYIGHKIPWPTIVSHAFNASAHQWTSIVSGKVSVYSSIVVRIAVPTCSVRFFYGITPAWDLVSTVWDILSGYLVTKKTFKLRYEDIRCLARVNLQSLTFRETPRKLSTLRHCRSARICLIFLPCVSTRYLSNISHTELNPSITAVSKIFNTRPPQDPQYELQATGARYDETPDSTK